MTSAQFLKSGLAAAAMVLFAASSFAGPTLDAKVSVTGNAAGYALDGQEAAKWNGNAYALDWDQKADSKCKGNNCARTPILYAFQYTFDSKTGASSFDIFNNLKRNTNGTFDKGTSIRGSSVQSLSATNIAMKGLGYTGINLQVQDKQNPGLDVDLSDIALNGLELTTGGNDQFPGAVYPGLNYKLYSGPSALEKITLNGIFKVTKNQFDGAAHTTGKNGDYKRNLDFAMFDLSFTGAKLIAKDSPAVVPEPTTLALLPLALGGALLASRRRKAAAK